MGELIAIFMILVFCIGMGVVVKEVLEHAAKPRLTKRSSRQRDHTAIESGCKVGAVLARPGRLEELVRGSGVSQKIPDHGRQMTTLRIPGNGTEQLIDLLLSLVDST